MKIKVEKFLALTSMIATAQLGAAGCIIKDEDPEETGKPEAEENDASTGAESAGDGGKADAKAPQDGEMQEEETADAAVASDAGTAASDASSSASADAGTADAAASDAGPSGAEGQGDAGDFDAALGEGNACIDAGDPTEELTYETCAQFDACFDTVGYSWASDVCWRTASENTAGVYLAMVDCITAADIADPCTEDADVIVSDCSYGAIQQACTVSVPGCDSVAENCSAVTEETCNADLSAYNTYRAEATISCFAGLVSSFGPDYDACAVDFDWCVTSPTGE